MNSPTTIVLFSKKRRILLLSLLMTTFSLGQENPANCEWTVYTFPNGNKASEGCIINGKPEGQWLNYHPNGILKSQGSRVDHELNGEWLFFDSLGNKIQSIEYERGKKQGFERIYGATAENNVLVETKFVDNLKSGWSNEFDVAGNRIKSVPFKENLEDGLGKEYALDGRVISILEYKKGYLRSVQKVNRKDEQGKKNGIWKTWNARDIVTEEGVWSNGMRNGIFKYYKGSGELDYLEKYEWGELVVDAEETIPMDLRKSYHDNGMVATSSTYSNGKRIGVYREYNREGEVISGAIYSNDTLVAEGITTAEGNKEGIWKHYYPGGALHFEGSYENGLKEGRWTYYAVTGEVIQKGAYSEGKFNGTWQWFYLNGNLHREENYRRGREDGSFEEWDLSGKSILRGTYELGRKQGEWIQDVNDHKEIGSYVLGEKEGEWVHTYPNGVEQFKGKYTFDLPDGKHIYRRISGSIQRIERYTNGEKNGKWIVYGPNQTVQQTLEYKEDRLHRIDGQKLKSKGMKSPEANDLP